MPAILAPPALAPERAAPTRPRKRWTVSEVHDLVALGKLSETGYELIEGDLITQMPKNMPHIVAVHNVLRWIYSTFGFEHTVSQDSVFISANSSPEPDVCVFQKPVESYLPNGKMPIVEAVLVVEVSDSTLDYDMTTKADLYARAGVTEYWVLDVAGRRLHVFTAPQNGAYPAPRTFEEADTAVAIGKPGMGVRVALLLP